MKSFRKPFILAAGMLAVSGLTVLANDPLSITQSGEHESFSGKDVTISGNAEVHVTSKTGLDNATVNLKGNDAWLYIDNVKPTVVLANYIAQGNEKIFIDGVAADIATNVRMAQYRGGTVLIPNGIETYAKALTVYDQPNCQGNSKEVAIETYHNDLGDFDNKIRSFKLKKGYQVCFANNADASGFSKIYIADTEDLVVNELPEGFVTKDGSDKAFISFIRVVKHQWVSKKGWCGWNQTVNALVNATHTYSWSADRPSDMDVLDREFVPQRHHRGWPGFDTINRQTNVSHLLGDNEPDNQNDPKELPSSPYEIAQIWPEYLKCGLRVGSPAPTGIWGSWLGTFFNLLDSLNYRCDFVVYHQYEPTTDFASRINRAVEQSKGRPVWVTEWNNGANWTNDSWPTASGPQRDADTNIIYYKLDADGNEVVCNRTDEGAYTKTVDRPLSPENAAKQLEYMKAALANQDALDKLERLHFYNAVQDARAVELGGKLTPAGKYFAEYNSKLAYRKSAEYDHQWKIAPPLPYVEYSPDFKNVRVKWYDHNGETGKNYIIWRRDATSGQFKEVARLELGKDYQAGETVTFEEKIDMADVRQYHVQATSYKDATSLNSRNVTITRDHVTEAPFFTAVPDDPYSVTIKYTVQEGTRAIRIERRDAEDAEFKVLEESYNSSDNSYKDKVLEAHDYWYRLTALSNSDETPVSEIVKVHTPSLNEAPEAVYNLFAASGDGQVVLSWDKTYMTTWKVEKAEAENGPFETLSASTSSLKYTDKKVENGKTYYYRLTPDRYGLTGNPSEVVAATPGEGQFIYIPFAETKGSTAKDYYNGNHATLNGTSYWTADRNGDDKGAVNVSSAGEGYVSLPGRIFGSVNDFTISVWFQKSKDGAKGRVFDFGSDTNNFMILDYGTNNANGFRFKFKGGGVEKNQDWNYPIEVGKWYHLSVSQTNKTATFYIDGVKIGSMTGSNNPSAIAMTNNWLGRSQWSSDPFADFAYDDLFIHNRALSEDEIKEVMGRTLDVNEIAFDAETTDGMTVRGHGDEITIISDAPRSVNVYNIDGALVRSAMIEEGVNVLTGFNAGIYIVGNHKVIL